MEVSRVIRTCFGCFNIRGHDERNRYKIRHEERSGQKRRQISGKNQDSCNAGKEIERKDHSEGAGKNNNRRLVQACIENSFRDNKSHCKIQQNDGKK